MKQSALNNYYDKDILKKTKFVEKDTGSHLSVLNVPVWNGKLTKAVDWLFERIRSGKKTRVGFANANNLNIAFENESLSEHYTSCDRVFADGFGIKIASIVAGEHIVDNVNGTDMLPVLCRKMENSGKGVFFIGGKKGVAERMIAKLRLSYPKLKISGFCHGYISDELAHQKVINQINCSGAELLIVAMGTPIQENWISKYESRIKLPVIMSAGGLFDFYSGNVSRAPLWMRKKGVEWIWRLIQEPGRLWRRYIIGNPLFVYRVLLASFKTKFQNEQNRFSLLKRCFDFTSTAIGLLLLSPVFLIIMACIKFDSRGNAFYSQSRIGKNGKEFKFWKFRSMVVGAHQQKGQLVKHNESEENVLFKIKKDPRITKVGKFIRRYSLDELPQLWNVLKGDMSLVGPRPALPEEFSLYSNEDCERLQVKPGITCFWQINGRSKLSFSEQMKLDKLYIEERSFLTDLKILIKTIPAVISGEGAY